MIVYLYYAYVMGAYYEQAIALYQTAYITENGGLYQTDFGTMISQKQIDATVTALWSDVEQTAGCILGDLRSNYHQDVAFEVVYQTPGGRMLNRTITGDSFVIENGANFWLRDPAEELAKYFDESLSEAFSGIAKFTIRAQSAADPTYLQIHDNAFFHVKTTEEGGFEYGRRFLKLDVEFGGKTMQTITLVLYKQIDSGPFAGGLGTEDYPYIIITAEQFAAISPQDTSKPSYADCQFILHNELNMEGKSFPGMRNFSGTFDGNGHEIYNVVLTGVGGDTAHTVGLFGELTGTVRNLVVRNATVTGLTADGDSGGRSGDLCVGVLAGLVNGGRIEYCAVYDSSVTGEHNGAGVAYAGGAVGKLAGKETGEAGEAALRGVVCVDTSVRAVTTKAANPQEFLPWADGSAIAGGLIGYYLTGTINECGYIQSENFQGSISAKGATGAAAGGLTGYERAPFSNLMWLALGAAPKVEKQNASAEDRYYQVGLLTGNGYAANAVYHLWGSRASERGSTPLNGDPWWQLQWSTKAVDKITTKALQDHIDGVNWKEKPYFDLEAYTEREDGAGLYPEFDLGTSGSEYQAVLLTDGPIRKNYVEGDYLTLSGLNVWQDVGFHVEEGAKYPYFEITEGANLINKPLPAGEYQFAVRASNGYRVTYKITVKPTEHIYISATTEPTCTEAGFTNLTCLHCGLTKRAGELEALGHDVVTDAAVPPTCVSDGLTEGSHCARCGEVFTAQTTVPSTGEHAHVVTPGKAATCTEPGLLEQTCRRCGAEQKTVLPVLESCAGTICPSHDYHDAPEFGHWSHAGIDYTLELGLFRGTSDTEFSPNVAMTRAMLVTVLYRLDGQKEPTGANPFTDVEPDSWYTEAVIWAVENEIVLGMGDGTFAPEAEITREQMAAILYRYAAYRGDDMTTDADLAAFPDEKTVSSYACEPLAWAVDRGLINGVAQNGESWLEPRAGATRAQVATILMRFLKQK